MIVSTRVASPTALSRPASSQAAPAQDAPSGDQVQLGSSFPKPLTFVPTTAGTFAMLGITGASTVSGVYLAAALAPGSAHIGGAAGALVGLVLAGVAGCAMDKQAEEHYEKTGQGTAWMKPAFTQEEITGLPEGSGVRGLL